MDELNPIVEEVPKAEFKPTAKKKSKAKPKAAWLPICRFAAEDFDEEAGRYEGAHCKVELQQEKNSKTIRTIKIDW